MTLLNENRNIFPIFATIGFATSKTIPDRTHVDITKGRLGEIAAIHIHGTGSPTTGAPVLWMCILGSTKTTDAEWAPFTGDGSGGGAGIWGAITGDINNQLDLTASLQALVSKTDTITSSNADLASFFPSTLGDTPDIQFNTNVASGFAQLDATGFIPSSIINVSGRGFLGVYDASVNTNPPDGVDRGDYHIISVAGTLTLAPDSSSPAVSTAVSPGDTISFELGAPNFWVHIANSNITVASAVTYDDVNAIGSTNVQGALTGLKILADTHNHDADYAPIIHGHTITDTTGLQAALDNKTDLIVPDAILDTDAVSKGYLETNTGPSIFRSETSPSSILTGGNIIHATPGPNITDVIVAAGTGVIVDSWTNTDDPTIIDVVWDEIQITIDRVTPFLGDVSIYVDQNGVVFQKEGELTSSEYRSFIYLGFVAYGDAGLGIIQNEPRVVNSVSHILYDYMEYLGDDNYRGLDIIATDIADQLSIWIGEGTYFHPGVNFNVDAKKPNEIAIPAEGDDQNPIEFHVHFSDGTVYDPDSNGGLFTEMPKVWESSPGNVTPILGNETVIHYALQYIGQHIDLQLANKFYPTVSDATANLTFDKLNFPIFATGRAIWLSAQIYVSELATDFSNPSKAGIINLLKGTAANGGGGTGAGIDNFLDLRDVTSSTYTSEANNVVSVNATETGLEFTTAITTWGTISGLLSNQNDLQAALGLKTDQIEFDAHVDDTLNPHQTTLDNLTDVAITTPATDDLISWDGGQWINIVPSSGTTYLELTDTDTTYTGAEGFTLKVKIDGTGVEFVSQPLIGSASTFYNFDAALGNANPGEGNLRFNDVDQTLVTQIYVHKVDANGDQRDLSSVTIGDVVSFSSNVDGDYVTYDIIATTLDFTNRVTLYVAYKISDGTGFVDGESLTAEVIYVPVKNFINLLDTPDAYATNANSLVRVNQAETGLEFYSGHTPLSINTQIGTAYTLAITDGGNMVRMSNNTFNFLSVPTDAVVPFPIGTEVLIQQSGSGITTIDGAGVTLQSAGGVLSFVNQFSVATLIKVETDTWAVMGDLE